MNHAEEFTISIDDRTLRVVVTRRRRQKHIHIRVALEGHLRVSVPLRCGIASITAALMRKTPWIERQIGRMSEYHARFDPDKSILYYGKRLEVRFVQDESSKAQIDIDTIDGACRLTGPADTDRIGLIRNRLEVEARTVLGPRIARLAEDTETTIARIYVRNQRTRWGASSSLGNISLNWRLVMAPEAVCDYLMYHELAHQRVMNHSSAFWELVATWCPEYESYDKWLSDHAYLLALFR